MKRFIEFLQESVDGKTWAAGFSVFGTEYYMTGGMIQFSTRLDAAKKMSEAEAQKIADYFTKLKNPVKIIDGDRKPSQHVQINLGSKFKPLFVEHVAIGKSRKLVLNPTLHDSKAGTEMLSRAAEAYAKEGKSFTGIAENLEGTIYV